jgi:hypothetical protein
VVALAVLSPFAHVACHKTNAGSAHAAAVPRIPDRGGPAEVVAAHSNSEDGALPKDDVTEAHTEEVPELAEPTSSSVEEAPSAASAGAGNAPEAPYRAALDERETPAQRSAARLASTSPAQCRAELKRRKLAIVHTGGSTPGVATPVRLSGELEGIRFLTPGRKSVFGVLDCRLSLVLAEFAKLLAEQDVAAIHIDNMYRPQAHLPGSKKKSQHAYGLAVDIYGFTLRDGTTLVVERDFHGTLGEPPCGPDAALPPDSDARALSLRNLACVIARARIFNYLLTPNYNDSHRDHIHADIQRKGRVHVVR